MQPITLDAVVLVGGRGTRLGALTHAVPKPLLAVDGAPFLLRLAQRLQHEGCRRVILSAQYLSEQVQAFVEAYRSQLPPVSVVVEPEPLGTGGALRAAAEQVRSERFVAVNGDSWVEQPLAPVVREHASRGWPMTVVAVRAERVVGGARAKARCVIGPADRLTGFTTEALVADGWVNAGLYVIDRGAARAWPAGRYSLEERLLSLVPGGPGVVRSEASLLDIGTPACYDAAGRWLAGAEVAAAATDRSA